MAFDRIECTRKVDPNNGFRKQLLDWDSIIDRAHAVIPCNTTEQQTEAKKPFKFESLHILAAALFFACIGALLLQYS